MRTTRNGEPLSDRPEPPAAPEYSKRCAMRNFFGNRELSLRLNAGGLFGGEKTAHGGENRRVSSTTHGGTS